MGSFKKRKIEYNTLNQEREKLSRRIKYSEGWECGVEERIWEGMSPTKNY